MPASVRLFGSPSRLAIRSLQYVALTIVLTIAFALGGIISGMGSQPAGPSSQPAAPAAPAATADAANAGLLLLLFSALAAAVLGWFIVESKWHGWRLIGAVFLAFYGSSTVVTQMESLVYLKTQLPAGMVLRLFLMGAIVAGIFSPLAVLILGKAKARPDGVARVEHPRWSAAQWAGRLAIITVGYLILYYCFGYFVAWKAPAVRAYYGGTDPGTFFAQIAAIWKVTPWMFAFQAARAILWTLFVLPAIRMIEGSTLRTALASSLLFAVWSGMLILPNAFMPEAVRTVHLIETLSSNLLFGFLVGSLLAEPQAAAPREVAWAR